MTPEESERMGMGTISIKSSSHALAEGAGGCSLLGPQEYSYRVDVR